MGCDISQWRMRIGSFCQSIGRNTIKYPAMLLNPNRITNLKLLVRITLCISAILLLSGDVELNPGPPPTGPNTRLMSLSQSKLSWDKGDNDALSRTLQEIRSEMTTMSTNMLAMKTEMTGVNQNIDKLNDKLDSKIDMLQTENKQLKSRVVSLENQVDKIEAGSRKNNLLFMGVDDKPSDVNNVFEDISNKSSNQKESWEECEMKIRLFLESVLELGKEFAENVQIEHVQRVRGTERKRPIIVRFLSYRDRNLVLKTAKNILKQSQTYRVNEDFTPSVRTARKNLSPFLLRARENGSKVSMRQDKLLIDSKLYTFDAETQDIQEVTRK